MVLTEAEKKERRKIAIKKYNDSKKGKLNQKKTRESQKCKEYQKNYHKTNKCKVKANEYYQSENGKKSKTKDSWKRRGLNMENFDEIYKRYTMAIFCDICECVLEDGKPMKRNTKCMDHCHITGEFRNIVCSWCNTQICK